MKTSKPKRSRRPQHKLGDNPPLSIPGFTPLVEASDDGSVLSALAETSLVMPWEECLRHTLVVGKTGAGKTLRFMLRAAFAAIRNPEMSLVVIDAQGSEEERIIRYARHVRGKDTRIIRINWTDAEFSTHYWNCLDSVSRRSEVYDIASSITGAMGEIASGDGLYFRQQATLLLSALFQALGVVGGATLGEAKRILDGGSRAMGDLAERAKVPELQRFATEIEMGNRNTETSVAEASNHLIALLDERVVRTTGASELDFETLSDEPTILILSLDEESVTRLRPLTNVFLHRLFSWIISSGRANGGPLRRPLGIFIDEFASAVGRLPNFERRAHTLRKRNAAIFAAVQSNSQIMAEYGPAAHPVMAAFNHRIFIPPVTDMDAREASDLSGMMATEEISRNSIGTPLNISPLHRPLLMPQEIAAPGRDGKLGPRLTFLMADTPPFQGWLRAAYELDSESPWVETSGVLPLRRRVLRRKMPEREENVAPARRFTAILGTTNTSILSNREIERRVAELKEQIGWDKTTGSARKWWESFESENATRKGVILQLAEELQLRKATISEFFLSYVYSNTNGILANLHYLDYSRLKAEEQKTEKISSARETGLPEHAAEDMTDEESEEEDWDTCDTHHESMDESSDDEEELDKLLKELLDQCAGAEAECTADAGDNRNPF